MTLKIKHLTALLTTLCIAAVTTAAMSIFVAYVISVTDKNAIPSSSDIAQPNSSAYHNYIMNDKNSDGYNSKLDRYAFDIKGYYGLLSNENQTWYWFDVDNFDAEPISLKIPDLDPWRVNSIKFSDDGEYAAVDYSTGYFEMWIGEQKYTQEQGEANKKDAGLYLYSVDDKGDFKLINKKLYTEELLPSPYKFSRFLAYSFINNELVIQYIILEDADFMISPQHIHYLIWNYNNDTFKTINDEPINTGVCLENRMQNPISEFYVSCDLSQMIFLDFTTSKYYITLTDDKIIPNGVLVCGYADKNTASFASVDGKIIHILHFDEKTKKTSYTVRYVNP